jgi:ubiquinone/menaquinone biosynthesis C-methylase UbiE
MSGDETAPPGSVQPLSRITNYDSVAGGYDVRYRTYDYAEIKGAIDVFLGAAPIDAVLEVGCGTGYWLRALQGRAATVAGVDFSAEMIARAKGSGAALVRARAESLPWRDAAFDRIVCINALHHFSDRERFFTECRRALKPGGAVMTVGLDPHARRDTWWIYEYFPETFGIDLERYPAVRTIRGELVSAGFSWSESYEVQTFQHVMTATKAFERGLVARSFSSQLAVLSAHEFEAGVARLRQAMTHAATDGREVELSSELHLFAVTGWIG